MQTYSLDLRTQAIKFVGGQSRNDQIRIMSAIRGLPHVGDIMPLKGRREFRLRVGSYRIIFERDDKKQAVTVTRIGMRGDVYQ